MKRSELGISVEIARVLRFAVAVVAVVVDVVVDPRTQALGRALGKKFGQVLKEIKKLPHAAVAAAQVCTNGALSLVDCAVVLHRFSIPSFCTRASFCTTVVLVFVLQSY